LIFFKRLPRQGWMHLPFFTRTFRVKGHRWLGGRCW